MAQTTTQPKTNPQTANSQTAARNQKANSAVIESGILYRSFALKRDQADKDARTIPIVFSSEEPGEQWFGREILDHSPGACMLERINSGGPLLKDHNPEIQTGVVNRGTAVIGSDRLGRCVVRFSQSPIGEQEFQDVLGDIRTSVSCGYRIHELRFESEENGMETYRATKWEPYEVSLVSIPMDFRKAGVGRNANENKNKINVLADNTENLMIRKFFILRDADPAISPGSGPAPIVAPPAAPPAIVRSASEIRGAIIHRQREIDTMMTRFASNTKLVTYLRGEMFTETELGAIQTRAMEMIATPEPLPGVDLTSAAVMRSIGEAFIKSEDYKKSARSKGTKRTVVLEVNLPDYGAALDGAPLIAARSMFGMAQRATGTTSGLTSIEKLPGIIELGVQMPRVAELIPQTGTDATTIRYIQENSLTNAAAAIGEEGLFPDAAWDWTETDANVRKIGVIGRVTEETFADYSQLQAYVNGRLRYMVDIKEDSELLNGTGNTNRIKGLLQFSGIQTQAMGADFAPDAVLKAITKVRTTGFFEPDSIVMNPNDWQNFQLMKDKNGQYIFGGPSNVGSYGGGVVMIPRLWGLPVITTTSIASGNCLVGAYRLGAGIFRKLVMVIETTNSDGDDFKYSRIAVRAETRLTLACYRPLAFCQVTGLQ